LPGCDSTTGQNCFKEQISTHEMQQMHLFLLLRESLGEKKTFHAKVSPIALAPEKLTNL
jgi:hypothetical protein